MNIKNNKIYGYDFEVFEKINWWCVTFISYPDRKEVITIINDINNFLEFYKEHKNDILVGYNSRSYDQFMYKGLLANMNIAYLNNCLIAQKLSGYKVIKNCNKYKLNNYDCMLADKSLKQLEAFMGSSIEETNVPFDIDRTLTEKEVNEIVKYNIHDVEETLKVLDYTKGDFDAQLDVIESFDLEISNFNRTKAQLAATVLNAVAQKTPDDEFEVSLPKYLDMPDSHKYIVDWYLNPINKTYKPTLQTDKKTVKNQLKTTIADVPCVFGWGGLHGSKDNKIFTGLLLIADVASLYPNLMVNEGFISRKILEPNKFNKMLIRRLKLKKLKDKRQKPLKIVINATYGIHKDKHSHLYDPLQSNNVCLAGQFYLTELTIKVSPYCEVLQVNTDGIYMKIHEEKNLDIVMNICKTWEKQTHLELEYDLFKRGKLVQKDVNNYILFDEDNPTKYKAKGSYVKKLKPIDYDLPILNKALINYFVYNIPVETTINECNDLIEFQKVVKLSAKYKEVIYGKSETIKVKNKTYTVLKDGDVLKEKVHRVFASTRPEDNGIYKVKNTVVDENGIKHRICEKMADTPSCLFIYNGDLKVDWYKDKETGDFKYNNCIKCPDYLDKQYYIDFANERIKQFIEAKPKKINKTPDLLYKSIKDVNNFYEFLENALVKYKVNKSDLDKYLMANCCSMFGRTMKLLEFRALFTRLYNKKSFSLTTLNKYKNETVQNIIKANSTLSKSGKTYSQFNYENALKSIFNILKNKDIEPYYIIKYQKELKNKLDYTNDDITNNDTWIVLNYRNEILPHVIIYNLKTKIVEYRKVNEKIYDIVPLMDGDIIHISNTKIEYGEKITGKDENGKNIYEVDETKTYDVIYQYEILKRVPKSDYKQEVEKWFAKSKKK